MKQKKSNRNRYNDIDADDDLENSAKISMNGDNNTVASSICTSSSSNDTTENLTDTDTSSLIKPDAAAYSNGGSRNGESEYDAAVRFSMNAIEFHEVESHGNFSAKERSNYWWSDREKDRMMAKHERLVAKYEQQRSATKPGTSKKSSGGGKVSSYRGLESWTAAGSLKLDYTIEQCISAVMDEQDRQWNENDDDSLVIAKKSLAVTEDSARRARLNGLQDAQEALRVRGESWTNKNTSDEMSVGSAVSTGTAAIAKKKKRSKLLARLDDSHKEPRNADVDEKEDVLASLKKRSSKDTKKDKKKKKKSSKKKSLSGGDSSTSSASKIKKKKKSKSGTGSVSSKRLSAPLPADDDDTEQDYTKSADSQTTSISRLDEQKNESLGSGDTFADEDVATTATGTNSKVVSYFMAGTPTPISPLSTHINTPTSTAPAPADEYPLLTTLRRQQEQLRQSSLGIHHHRHPSTIHDDDDYSEDASPLLQTLRRQQKQQAITWQNEQQENSSDGCNGGSPTESGAKCTSLREETRGGEKDTESMDSSDPPGRRPRRLASRHVEGHHAIPEHSTVNSNSSVKISPSTNTLTKSPKSARSRSKSTDRKRPQMLSGSSYTPPPSFGTSIRMESQRSERDPEPSIPPASWVTSPGNAKKSLNILRSGAKGLFKKNNKKS
mmetsp:Transcript_16271/g.33443  ORF Transcript_16271/g.33443 Transcript_16271/m.33443 type:complete len:666 (+) Transcript_16271:264-2261(+)|eukprot:CAMPEP_0201131442 /NCGR_PEP_ID=MMETSP0850-20130426/42813_1 /ASSEMBLY_ACC=CAM_ASM_000622 /TAXON_ID=183588 /ORGANISM="Pseudo-nitzschia fraudulenta, Strain WWA7" /LENGTH=665 /DNA_ID=CAMNT_0047401481 /DNA_START=215 /DNA_END=2212 /DNA_ORIENTATION=-